MILCHAVPWVALCTALLGIVPRFDKIYRDFGMKLPWLTEAVILLSRWVGGFVFLPLALLVLLALDFAVLFLVRREPGARVLGRLWFFLMLLVPVAALVICVVALWLPYQKLHEGLSK